MALPTFTDEELFDDAHFDAWNKVLTPLGRLRALGQLSELAPAVEAGTVGPLYDVALELRDRLRFSQLRMHQLKSELSKTHSLLTLERHQGAQALADERLQAQVRYQQAQEQLQGERDRAQALVRQLQDELSAEHERNRDALAAQQARARRQLSQECQAAQEHAAAEYQRAAQTVEQVEAQLQEERDRGDRALAQERKRNQDTLAQERQRSQESAAQERQKAEAKIAALDAQVRHLNQAVQDQAALIAAHERSAQRLQDQLVEAQQQLQEQAAATQQQMHATASQIRNAEDRAERAETARRDLATAVHDLRHELDGWRGQAEAVEGRHDQTMHALLATKAELSELSHLQGLYLAAKEELARLDKENIELKEMIQGQVYELTQSRILDTVSPSRHDKSTPLYMTPEMIGKRRPRSSQRSGRASSPGREYRDRILAATGVIYPPDVADSIKSMAGSLLRKPPMDGPSHVAEAAQLAQLAFLGPPSSAYPTDPDKFVFVRVAGGFSPKYVGSEPLPKASGWIPKDVLRLAQAFKHSHSIKVDWSYWEPFLLMVNEAYHRTAGAGGQYHGGLYGSGAYTKAGGGAARHKASPSSPGATAVYRPASARAASPSRVPAAYQDVYEQYGFGAGGDVAQQYASRMASYPSVIQTERILALRKELSKARAREARGGGGVSAREQRERDDFIRTMAEKDYHILNELGETVGENQRLRRTVQLFVD